MLGKLLKYEFKSTMRLFLPTYAATIVFALLSRLFLSVSALQNFWGGRLFSIVLMLYVLIILMTFVLTFVLVIQRFYKNLLRDEGYLSNTLPVSVDSHIWGKAIPATIWSILSFIVVMASLFILILSKDNLTYFMDNWSSFLSEYNTYTSMSIGLLIFELIILLIISILSSTMAFYASLCIGQLANSHKVLLSIVAYFCLGIVVGMLTTAISGSALINMGDLFVGDYYYDTNTYTGTIITAADIMQVIGITAITQIVTGAIYYFISRYVLKRKLNLE